MSTIQDLQTKYENLSPPHNVSSEGMIDNSKLLAFDYAYVGQKSEIAIDTEEFTAVCPWTGLPDFGTLTVEYIPDRLCIELKSLKYYLLSFSNVGIVQEHAANRILNDLTDTCQPIQMTVTLDFRIRGGLHTKVTVSYQKCG